jgi:hypothetical protein
MVDASIGACVMFGAHIFLSARSPSWTGVSRHKFEVRSFQIESLKPLKVEWAFPLRLRLAHPRLRGLDPSLENFWKLTAPAAQGTRDSGPAPYIGSSVRGSLLEREAWDGGGISRNVDSHKSAWGHVWVHGGIQAHRSL